MAGAAHLIRRFAGSLWPGGPSEVETAWVEGRLLPGEVELWRRMSGPDRRHAAAVARRVQRALGDRATRPVLAAALLHDVGKVVSGLGTYGRVVATMSAAAAGRDAAPGWSAGRGVTRRIGLYVRHPELGADLLALAGSDPLTVAWAREHHLPPDRWTVAPDLASALKAADDD
ncbi:hypothetical protein BH20ACT2_BH20ACT2_15720 [soil metagenome]